uniref:Uncharacterized protein n=1 Tax=Anguilla anguilla TaxID=7936 RepID=A0A0E9W229_ANGAN
MAVQIIQLMDLGLTREQKLKCVNNPWDSGESPGSSV